uniref:Metalloprotease n=1 Tax=Rhipicephalus zambeziensis TaxID=60191 RepID=A0A224YLT2_9ACAR
MAFRVTNHKPGDVLHYPLVLLCGVCSAESSATSVSVANLSGPCPDQFTPWPTTNGAFKVIVQLARGRNDLVLKHDGDCQTFTLFFEPVLHHQCNFVRLVYVTCPDAPQDGNFQGPEEEDCSIESARSRIGLGMQILQMVMAETLAASGIGHKSFCLECTEGGGPVVHVFKSELRYGEARAMMSEDIWNHVATELMNSKLRDGDRCKFVAFLSWTRYQGDGVRPTTHSEVMKRVSGHVMVGAGGLALCGTGCLYTWAQNVDELSWRLYDTRCVDHLRFMDDSNYRGTLSACYSSTLGGVLHELGHTFGLGHTTDGIMGHGFHDISCIYTVSTDDSEMVANYVSAPAAQPSGSVDVFNKDPPLPGKIRLTTLEPKKKSRDLAAHIRSPKSSPSGAKWTRSCAIILSYHPWLNISRTSNVAGSIQFHNEQRLTSPHGIRLVEFRRAEDAMVIDYWEFPEGVEEVCIEASKLHFLQSPTSVPSLEQEQEFSDIDSLYIFAIDTAGNILGRNINVPLN